MQITIGINKMAILAALRTKIRENSIAGEAKVISDLIAQAEFSKGFHDRVHRRATQLVESIRHDSKPSLMEVFLAEYGLSTEEGVALMCLAEALLRVPDPETIDALIEDKIAPSAWGLHLGKSNSPLVNASTWALMITGKVLKDGEGIDGILRGAIKRIGEPIIRSAIARAMKELGAQFVLGETIDAAISAGASKARQGYTYSYDMLGEAALTEADAKTYFNAYSDAIANLAGQCTSTDIRQNPGISIKLSALHPRYEYTQSERVMEELVPRALSLAQQAKDAGMGLNIDAEEADRLDISLDIIEAVLSDPSLKDWDGFGIVVQAYGKRASGVIDWLYALSEKLDRKIMVRLVKGAYWDTEIKRAQVEGLSSFPVFTRKPATDVSYICNAKKLLQYSDRIYPQFATHNAHSIAAILEMGAPKEDFEFQRLHGMGEALHDQILQSTQSGCRIYAPVGPHKDLLAYLVRRLLENGANSSFVNQIVDPEVPATEVAADPFELVEDAPVFVRSPAELFMPERNNSKGWDIHDEMDVVNIEQAREPFKTNQWDFSTGGVAHVVKNPAISAGIVGQVEFASKQDIEFALSNTGVWAADAKERARILNAAADLYEANFGELFALLIREAGKTVPDAIAELREAVDFLRYYGARGLELARPARGVIACISPWNFPLAIFTGQIAGALSGGNGVIAKPAETTNLIAISAVNLLHHAGVPSDVLRILIGDGAGVGAALTRDPRIDGVCFTGSTRTAQAINRSMAHHLCPNAPLIAETGGLNAMIVDSTALPEQAIRDIIVSAFQSAGQRCSALRVLYLQNDIRNEFLTMLFGAMDELIVGDPWQLSTDIGPVIDRSAKEKICGHISRADREGKLLKSLDVPSQGNFVPPSVIAVNGIGDLEEEIFGPVLHIAGFEADELGQITTDINASGYGLTFGMHSRIDDRIADVTDAINVGNIYINRNQIGAVVGSQPFGGEGLSGTGPKAGGPTYVSRLARPGRAQIDLVEGNAVQPDLIQKRVNSTNSERRILSAQNFPGPTGESNRMSTYGRGIVLCLGPTRSVALEQAKQVLLAGCQPICIAPGIGAEFGIDGTIAPGDLSKISGIAAVVSYATDDVLRKYRVALADRVGPIVPLCCEDDLAARLTIDRHICIDTTAAGGNAALLSLG